MTKRINKQVKIVLKSRIQSILDDAVHIDAYPTSRILPFPDQQEWCGEAEWEGKNIMIYWIFDNDQCTSVVASDYWMDGDAVSRIVEVDEDGEEVEELA